MQKDDAYNFDAWDSMEKYKVDISKLESFEDPIWR